MGEPGSKWLALVLGYGWGYKEQKGTIREEKEILNMTLKHGVNVKENINLFAECRAKEG